MSPDNQRMCAPAAAADVITSRRDFRNLGRLSFLDRGLKRPNLTCGRAQNLVGDALAEVRLAFALLCLIDPRQGGQVPDFERTCCDWPRPWT